MLRPRVRLCLLLLLLPLLHLCDRCLWRDVRWWRGREVLYIRDTTPWLHQAWPCWFNTNLKLCIDYLFLQGGIFSSFIVRTSWKENKLVVFIKPLNPLCIPVLSGGGRVGTSAAVLMYPCPAAWPHHLSAPTRAPTCTSTHSSCRTTLCWHVGAEWVSDYEEAAWVWRSIMIVHSHALIAASPPRYTPASKRHASCFLGCYLFGVFVMV